MKFQNVLKNNTLSFKFGLLLLILGFVVLLGQKLLNLKNKRIEVLPSSTPVAAEKLIVSKVIDGDTVILSTGNEVRYIGIDAPEIEGEECFAAEAAKANSDLILGKEVKLVKDVSDTDKYGRLLRYVYVEDPELVSESVFVNNYLVKNGYAKVMTVSPDTKFENLFISSENYARENKLGLWGKCGK